MKEFGDFVATAFLAWFRFVIEVGGPIGIVVNLLFAVLIIYSTLRGLWAIAKGRKPDEKGNYW